MTNDRHRVEAALLERYGEFKRLVIRLVGKMTEQPRALPLPLGGADAIYRSLQLGIRALGVDGLAMLGEGGRHFWWSCFSKKMWAVRKEVCDLIGGIDVSDGMGIRHKTLMLHGKPLDIVVVPVVNDIIFLINPYKVAEQNHTMSTAWFPVAATYRELIEQYRQAATKWTYNAGEEWWRAAEEANEAGGLGQDADMVSGTMETVTISLDLRKSTFAMEQAKENKAFAEWMKGLITELTGHAQKCGAIFDKFTGDGVIVHFPVNPPWVQQVDRNSTLTKALFCAADLVGIVDKHLPGLLMNLHNNSGRFGAGIGMAMADAQWDVDTNGQFMVVGKGVVGACRAADGAHAGRIRLVNSAYQPISAIPGVKLDRFRLKSFKTKEFSKELDVSVWEVKASDVDGILPH